MSNKKSNKLTQMAAMAPAMLSAVTGNNKDEENTAEKEQNILTAFQTHYEIHFSREFANTPALANIECSTIAMNSTLQREQQIDLLFQERDKIGFSQEIEEQKRFDQLSDNAFKIEEAQTITTNTICAQLPDIAKLAINDMGVDTFHEKLRSVHKQTHSLITGNENDRTINDYEYYNKENSENEIISGIKLGIIGGLTALFLTNCVFDGDNEEVNHQESNNKAASTVSAADDAKLGYSYAQKPVISPTIKLA